MLDTDSLRERMCGHKAKHKTIGGAQKALRIYRKTHPDQSDEMNYYKCRFCNCYHIGHRRHHRSQIKAL